MILGWNGKDSEIATFFKICEVTHRGVMSTLHAKMGEVLL